MPNRLTLLIGLVLLLALGGSALTARHYQRQAESWRDSARQNQQALKTANRAIARQRQQQQQVAALDKQHTEELAHAQATIDDLRRAVAAGTQRLQFNTACPLPDSQRTARAPSVADAARPRLTDAAERHYFDLRQRIATADQQIAGLQGYIRTICLKPLRKLEQ
ncbi:MULTISPECIES: lysis protein [Yersinia]|uniref:lysis protein n=1 Tax=Yersinia TaxID=629 RepID=UPI0007E3245C|nr:MULTISPECIES: lysis protein [Yersinia]